MIMQEITVGGEGAKKAVIEKTKEETAL